MPKCVRSWTAIALLTLSARLLAAEVAVPPELQPWQGWVLQGEEFRRCPFVAGTQSNDARAFQCAWPERLVLDLDARGGRFAQRWALFADTWIALPGDLEHWPRDVQLDGATRRRPRTQRHATDPHGRRHTHRQRHLQMGTPARVAGGRRPRRESSR